MWFAFYWSPSINKICLKNIYASGPQEEPDSKCADSRVSRGEPERPGTSGKSFIPGNTERSGRNSTPRHPQQNSNDSLLSKATLHIASPGTLDFQKKCAFHSLTYFLHCPMMYFFGTVTFCN